MKNPKSIALLCLVLLGCSESRPPKVAPVESAETSKDPKQGPERGLGVLDKMARGQHNSIEDGPMKSPPPLTC